jgi:hypothetical protein
MTTSSFGMVAIVFGVIGLLFGMSDIRDFLHHPADKMAWWYTHMTRMLSAYIATVTAFSVVNFQFLPSLVGWLWATVAGLWVSLFGRNTIEGSLVVTALTGMLQIWAVSEHTRSER